MGITGTTETLRTTLREAGAPEDAAPGTLSLLVIKPTGQLLTYGQADIAHDGVGDYSKAVLGDVSGEWHYRWIVDGRVADEGSFTMESEWDGLNSAPDLTDLRIWVPKARRACEGPYGAPPGLPVLTDEQIYQMVADACADVIVLTGTLFGHELKVKGRDPLVGFATEWRTEAQLTEWEGGVIVTQAAINFVYHALRDIKTAETIRDEGQEWSYERSANLLVLQVKQLTEARDKALEMLERIHAPLDVYVSSVAERDKLAAAYIEPWVAEIGAPVPYAGLSGATMGGFDFRFGTWG